MEQRMKHSSDVTTRQQGGAPNVLGCTVGALGSTIGLIGGGLVGVLGNIVPHDQKREIIAAVQATAVAEKESMEEYEEDTESLPTVVDVVPSTDGSKIDGPAAPAPGLTRQQSLKDVAGSAAAHYKEHKWKYIACKVFAGLAIGLGIGLGIVRALQATKTISAPSLQARLAAAQGVTIKPVSILPAKGAAATSRRLLGSFLRRVLATTAIDPSAFASTSDYNVAGSPNYVVGDQSAGAVSIINTISCYVDQLRIADIGLNTTENPKLLPYVALVNQKLCASGDESVRIATWYVQSTGPAVYGSDGKYTTNAIVADQETIYIQIENVLSSGNLATSKIYFQGRDMTGTLQMDFSSADKTDISFVLKQTYASLTINQYLHAIFNPKTFTGSAVSDSVEIYYDGADLTNPTFPFKTRTTVYALDFTANAINRKQTVGANAATSMCIDFSETARMLIGNRYTLYSALDGSALNFQSGFSISHKFPAYADPVSAYASFWGVYADYGTLSDGTSEDTSALWVDGLSVDKLNYDGSTSALTLKVANARLQKISRRAVSLDTIKGLPLYVDTYSQNKQSTYAIAWDGTQLNVVSRVNKGCFNSGSSVNDFVALASGESVTKYTDCQCLVSAGNNQYKVSTSASDVFPSTAYFMDKGEADVTDSPLAITAALFPRGIDVRSKDYTLSGKIQIEYDAIQTLWGVDSGSYMAGGTVKQASSGATGTVYKTTKSKIFGIASNSTNPKINVASGGSPSDCSLQNNNAYSYTQGYVDAGAMVSQTQAQTKSAAAVSSKNVFAVSSAASIKVGMMVTGTGIPDYTYVTTISGSTITVSNSITVSKDASLSFSVVGLVTEFWWGYGSGLSFDYFTPNNAATFDISGVALTVMMPPPDLRNDYPFSYVTSYSGSLAWGTDGLSTDWSSAPTITTASYTGCSDGTLVAAVTGVTGATVDFYASSGTLWYVWVSNAGSSCINPSVTFTCSGGSTALSSPPVVSGLVCNKHISAVSSSIIVKLPTPTSTKFTASYAPSGFVAGDHSITYTPPSGSNQVASAVGSAYWSNADVGDARLPSGTSSLIYRTQSVVMPGESVPELLCSSGAANCPKASAIQYPVFKASITIGSKSVLITTPSTTGPSLTSSNSYDEWDGMSVTGAGVEVGPTDKSNLSGDKYNQIASCSDSTHCTLKYAATATATGVVITGSNSAGTISMYSDSAPKYGPPSHLDPSVSMKSEGACKMTGTSTGPPSKTALTAKFENIGGSPVIELQWDSGTKREDGTGKEYTEYSVSFMRLTDRGMGCKTGESYMPTVVWEAGASVTCDSLPKAAITCDDSSGSDVSDFRQGYLYSFNSLTGALTDSTASTGGLVLLDDNNFGPSSSSSSSWSNYASFGPFFPNTDANKKLLTCDWDSGLGCGYKVYEELDTFYTYTTGPSPNAQRVSMVDAAGKTILFDQPKSLTYRHSGTASNSKTHSYNGVLMMLQYNGPGDLQGFPQVCLDANMEVSDCILYGNSATTNFPDITLPENVPLTDLDGAQYYARAAEVTERYPKAADQTLCSALKFSSLPSVPDIAKLFVAPSNANAPLPTDAQLAKSYLNQGNPEAIGGVTLYELKAIAAKTAK